MPEALEGNFNAVTKHEAFIGFGKSKSIIVGPDPSLPYGVRHP